MISFLIALLALGLGYRFYGKYISGIFAPETDRKTPAYTLKDGVDYIPMATWKVYMIQFLNIAGLGPIFGAIMGAKFGTASYLWIVFGTIFAGAVHDYLSAMISLRMDGASLPEIIGDELGSTSRLVMRIVTLVLMICVGASFIMIPAGLMVTLMSDFTSSALLTSNLFWTILMFAFYLCVTIFSPIPAAYKSVPNMLAFDNTGFKLSCTLSLSPNLILDKAFLISSSIGSGDKVISLPLSSTPNR